MSQITEHAYVDVRHRLVLWRGEKEEIEEHFVNIRNACRRTDCLSQFKERARVILMSSLSEDETDFVDNRMRLPRRAIIRLFGKDTV